MKGDFEYTLAIRRSKAEGDTLPLDYLKGYLASYENEKSTLSKVFEVLHLSVKPARIVGYRTSLEERVPSAQVSSK